MPHHLGRQSADRVARKFGLENTGGPAGEIDRGGAINTITPHNTTSKNATGMAVSSFLVEVEKTDLDKLRNQYPEAFKRKFNPGAGLRFDAWVEKKSW